MCMPLVFVSLCLVCLNLLGAIAVYSVFMFVVVSPCVVVVGLLQNVRRVRRLKMFAL